MNVGTGRTSYWNPKAEDIPPRNLLRPDLNRWADPLTDIARLTHSAVFLPHQTRVESFWTTSHTMLRSQPARNAICALKWRQPPTRACSLQFSTTTPAAAVSPHRKLAPTNSPQNDVARRGQSTAAVPAASVLPRAFQLHFIHRNNC